jgi:hypothetical protein
LRHFIAHSCEVQFLSADWRYAVGQSAARPTRRRISSIEVPQ